MKAIVGLGNPGGEYDATRHNVGFNVIDELARRRQVRLRSWKATADLGKIGDVLFAKPKTFMNLSGAPVQRLVAFHQIEPADVLVVVDDVNLPLGRLRLRRSGSAGGHNGLKSIAEHLGTEFPRLRVGVGRGDPSWDLADHVLSTFTREERPAVEQMIERAADAVETFITDGIETAMNRFNAADDKAGAEETR